jgi:hypothetical protein
MDLIRITMLKDPQSRHLPHLDGNSASLDLGQTAILLLLLLLSVLLLLFLLLLPLPLLDSSPEEYL